MERQNPTWAPAQSGHEAPPRWTYGEALLLGLLAFPSALVALVIAQLIGLLGGAGQPPTLAILAAQLVAYGLWFGWIAAFLRVRYQLGFWTALGWRAPRYGYVIYVYAGPGLAVLIGALGIALRTPEIDMPMKQLLADPASIVLVGLFASTLGPVCEELAFRGFLLPTLQRAVGTGPAVVITAAVFSALHGPQYAWSWRHLVLITVAGVAFGLIRVLARSTLAASLTHASYNFCFLIAYLLHAKAQGC